MKSLVTRTADGSIHPLLHGSALGGQGVPALVDHLIRLIPPSPTAPGTPRGTVFAVRPGPGRERTAYLRLYDGEVAPQQRLTFRRQGADGRAVEVSGRVTRLEVIGRAGPLTAAGNIGALTGPKDIRVGDRLGELTERAPQFAPPTLETVVRARRPERAAALRSALLALADQDPLLHARPAASGATVLLLYGEVQKEVVAATLVQDFGIEAEFEPSRVRFLERPAGTGRPGRSAPGTTTPTTGRRSGCASSRASEAPAGSSPTRPNSARYQGRCTRRSRTRSTRPCSAACTAHR